MTDITMSDFTIRGAGITGLMERYDTIGDVRGGHGLMAAIEVVSDRATKAPASGATMNAIFATAHANGVMLRISGPNIIMSPPLIIDAADVDEIIGSLDKAFAAL